MGTNEKLVCKSLLMMDAKLELASEEQKIGQKTNGCKMFILVFADQMYVIHCYRLSLKYTF